MLHFINAIDGKIEVQYVNDGYNSWKLETPIVVEAPNGRSYWRAAIAIKESLPNGDYRVGLELYDYAGSEGGWHNYRRVDTVWETESRPCRQFYVPEHLPLGQKAKYVFAPDIAFVGNVDAIEIVGPVPSLPARQSAPFLAR